MKLYLKDGRIFDQCDQKTLEQLFSITYLSSLEYKDWRVERYLRKKCAYIEKKGRIGQNALWLGTLHSKEIKKHSTPHVTIVWISEQKGYGVMANENFPPWQFIGEYTGLVRPRKIFFPDINDYCFMFPRQWWNFRPMTIDSEKYGNFTRFINHSDYPNLESLAVFHEGMMHIIFRTIREVRTGEELTYDYGDIYWRKRIKIQEAVDNK